MYTDVMDRISRLIETRERSVIAIEGPAASGKTTLAAYLEKQFDCNIIHMDDFFLRPHQRTAERLSRPGGNIDIERFCDEVRWGIESGGEFSYRRFDCSQMNIGETVNVGVKPLYVIEGVYSLHPLTADMYDLAVFMDADDGLRRERLRKRESPEKFVMYCEKWMPLEDAYYREIDPKTRFRACNDAPLIECCQL